jgi:hypothetical protein
MGLMRSNIDTYDNQPLWQLTVEEFQLLIKTSVSDILSDFEGKREIKEPVNYVDGLDGLASFLGCSKASALKIKNSGKINCAIIYISKRKFRFDTSKITECLK